MPGAVLRLPVLSRGPNYWVKGRFYSQKCHVHVDPAVSEYFQEKER